MRNYITIIKKFSIYRRVISRKIQTKNNNTNVFNEKIEHFCYRSICYYFYYYYYTYKIILHKNVILYYLFVNVNIR